MSRVLLVTSAVGGVIRYTGKWLNLTMVYIAGELQRQGHDVSIYDAAINNHGILQICEKILDYRPDVVLTTAGTSSMGTAAEILAAAKRVLGNVTTVIGGIYPTLRYQEVLDLYPAIDFVVRGEGDLTFSELVNVLESNKSLDGVAGIAYISQGQVKVTAERPLIKNLDSLTPAWDLLEWRDYTYYIFPGSRLGVVSTSRGCGKSCWDCTQIRLKLRCWRARSVESVTAEIEMLVREFELDVILIANELSTRDQARWTKILDWLITKKLDVKLLVESTAADIIRDKDIIQKYKRAGIVHILMGIGPNTIGARKTEINKVISTGIGRAVNILDNAGIISELFCLIERPEENIEKIRMSSEMAKLYSPDFVHFACNPLWNHPDLGRGEFLEHLTSDYYRYCYGDSPATVSVRTSQSEIERCYEEYYFGKLKEWAGLRPGFKRDYIGRYMRLLTNYSYIAERIPQLKPFLFGPRKSTPIRYMP